jgi:hypothetical protein
MFTLEALPAKHGDALLLHFGQDQLVVIDGGPPGVYNKAVRPRLEKLRLERQLGPTDPLDIELMMVSHVDEDHVAGILELVQKMKDLQDSHDFVPWRIKRFWQNSFEDTVAHGGGTSVGGAALGADAAAEFASAAMFAASTISPASVKQGRDLAKLLPAIKPSLAGNKPFNGLVQFGTTTSVPIGPLKLTVVGPNAENIAKLRKEWAEQVVAIIKDEKDKGKIAAIVADFVDKSPFNLSSIVVLAECEGKSMLLTGDGRGDHTLEELEKAGLLPANGGMQIDLLKLPHHGSVRNVAKDYFERIRATHYVISADGKFDNPDVATLKLISEARPDDKFTIHLTYPLDAFTVPAIGAAVKAFFDADKAKGRKYKVVTRQANEESVKVDL